MDTMETRLGSRRRLVRIIKTAGWALGVFAALWFVVTLLVGAALPRGFEEMGAIGESMAFVGVIATAAALGIASYSLLLQRDDIGMQIHEMREATTAQKLLANAQLEDNRIRKWEQVITASRDLNAEVEKAVSEGWSHIHHNESLRASPKGSFEFGDHPVHAAQAWHKYTEALGSELDAIKLRIDLVKQTAAHALAGDPNYADSTPAATLDTLRAVREAWRGHFYNAKKAAGLHP